MKKNDTQEKKPFMILRTISEYIVAALAAGTSFLTIPVLMKAYHRSFASYEDISGSIQPILPPQYSSSDQLQSWIQVVVFLGVSLILWKIVFSFPKKLPLFMGMVGLFLLLATLFITN